MAPEKVAYYDGVVEVDLSTIKPMIAMPFHPSNVYTIEELNNNLEDILRDVEKKALVSLDNNNIDFKLTDKIHDGRLYVEQGVIAGCAGGGFENLCDAADILRGKNIGADEFSLSVYPASQPIFMELVKNGRIADLMEAGATVPLSAVHVLVPAMCQATRDLVFAIRQETSRTVRARKLRMDRLLLLHLWMLVRLRQLLRIRDI